MTKIGTFFDINKSTTTNRIKFKQLLRQSSLKNTLKRCLNHSRNRYTRKQQQITSTLTEIFRNKFIFHIIINYSKLLLYSSPLIGRQLSKLAERKEGKAMNKDTLFIMNKIWRLLLQQNTPIYTKNFYCLLNQWAFQN